MSDTTNYDSFDEDDETVEFDHTLDLSEEADPAEIMAQEKADAEFVGENFTDGLDEDDNAEAIMLLNKADRMVKKYNDLVLQIKPTTSDDEKANKDFSAWKKEIKPATLTADTSDFDEIIDNPDSTKEELLGVIRLLDKLRTDAENTLQSKYALGRVSARPVLESKPSVDLDAERKKIVSFLNSLEQQAKDGVWDGLTTDRLYSAPNVKRKERQIKNSTEKSMTWDIPMAPRQGSNTWTGVRSNNSTMKLVIDGEVPEGHPFWIGEAVREFLGMSTRQFRILAGEIFENNDYIFDWTDEDGVSHKIGQRKVQS
jgi:hypothetical protein